MAQNKKHSILVLADSDSKFMKEFSEFLSGLEITVKCFQSGQQVINDLKNKECPFLYIINMNLKDVDGFSTIDCIRKSHCKEASVVVLLTALNSALQEKAVKRHVLCTIPSPVNFPELKSLVIKTYEQYLEKIFKAY